MSIKIDMTSNDLDRQLELLKYYPEVVVKHYKPALVRSTGMLSAIIEPLITSGVSGRARDTFGSKVSGRTLETIKGQVGWSDKDDPFYVKILESGAKAHEITPGRISGSRYQAGLGKTNVLSWMDGGEFVFTKTVHHPGISKVGMMAAGWSALQPIIETELDQAGKAVLQE